MLIRGEEHCDIRYWQHLWNFGKVLGTLHLFLKQIEHMTFRFRHTKNFVRCRRFPSPALDWFDAEDCRLTLASGHTHRFVTGQTTVKKSYSSVSNLDSVRSQCGVRITNKALTMEVYLSAIDKVAETWALVTAVDNYEVVVGKLLFRE